MELVYILLIVLIGVSVVNLLMKKKNLESFMRMQSLNS